MQKSIKFLMWLLVLTLMIGATTTHDAELLNKPHNFLLPIPKCTEEINQQCNNPSFDRGLAEIFLRKVKKKTKVYFV
jgi:hypothetical protein